MSGIRLKPHHAVNAWHRAVQVTNSADIECRESKRGGSADGILDTETTPAIHRNTARPTLAEGEFHRRKKTTRV
jgi:hypothetical protein